MIAVMGVRRRFAVALLLIGVGMLLAPHVRAASRQADVVGVGVINDVTARTLDAAIADQPAVLVLDINSAGGTEPALDHMLSSLAAGHVPVVAYVDDGAMAQDEGLILAESADLIGVGTTATLGAPRPMHFSQAVAGITDAGTLASQLASRHHREGAWAKVALDRGDVVPGSDAVTRAIANYQASSVSTLIQDGLNRKDLSINQVAPGGWDSVLNVLATPDAAYLLMVITLALLALWFAHPGMVLTLAGALAAGVASVLAFSQLPINIMGVVLTAAASVIFVLDIVAATHGLLTAVGAVVMVLGGWQLVNTNTMAAGVDLGLIAVTVGVIVAGYGVLIPRLLAVRRLPYATDPATQLIGQTATVTEALEPEGMVNLRGTLWRARTGEGTVEVGRRVEIVKVEGLRLTVK
jgi:membrane-bound serine protease (ClpP class)